MNTMKFLAGSLGILLTACSMGGLGPLILKGHEMHPSLKTRLLAENPIRHVRRDVVRANPYNSTDADFVRAIARSGSQGRLDAKGIRSALYALYLEERELGFYGLEAESVADANRLESALREIWSHNVSLDRAQVHREGLILVVVWTDGVSPECWEAVNTVVAKRLMAQ